VMMKYTYFTGISGCSHVIIYSDSNAVKASDRCMQIVNMEDEGAIYFLDKKEMLIGNDNMYWRECK